MSFVIISGKNQGYPAFSEQAGVTGREFLVPPYPFRIFMSHPEVENGYPFLNSTPELCSLSFLTEPFPVRLPYSAEGINSGYPLPKALPPIGGLTFSRLISAGAPVQELYFGSRQVTAAYFGDEAVFVRV